MLSIFCTEIAWFDVTNPVSVAKITVVLLSITAINIVLFAIQSKRFLTIAGRNSGLEKQNKTLIATNKTLAATIGQMTRAETKREERIEFLEHQMAQVHDWLGRLTISDFLKPDTAPSGDEFSTTAEIMEELTDRARYAEEDRRRREEKY